MMRSIVPLLLLVAVPILGVSAQEREIVFNQVTVAGGEAALTVEFDDGEELLVSFRDGSVIVSGDEVGSYAVGGPLDAAWRSLLGQAVAMDNGQIEQLLREWSPPEGLDTDAAATARALQERLRTELSREPATAPGVVQPQGDLQEAVQALVFQTDRLRALTAAVRELRTENLRVHVGEDIEIDAGETVEASLLMLDGHLSLEGRVEGDVILLGGSMSVGDDGHVEGDLRWADADVGGVGRRAVSGRISEIQPVADRPEADLREEIRREVRAAMGADRSVRRGPIQLRLNGRSALGNIAEGLARLFQTLITFAILFGIGLALLYFFPRNFEVVARTAQNATGRSALVGLASGILFGPLWIVGIVVLAITIIGIPVMLLWIPLFPLAFALAMTLGLLAVARNLGRWASDRHIQGFTSLDGSRPAIQLGAGLTVLLSAFALAAVFQMGGAWLSLFHGLLAFLGVLLMATAMCVGLGATILSRGGRDPLYAGTGWSWDGETDPWAPEPDPFDPEPGPYDPEPGRYDPEPGRYDPEPGPHDPDPAPRQGGTGHTGEHGSTDPSESGEPRSEPRDRTPEPGPDAPGEEPGHDR